MKQPDMQFLNEGTNWLLELGLIDNDMIMNNIVMLCFTADNKIKDVSIDIDKIKNKVYINLSMRNWHYWFSNKNKIREKLIMTLEPIRRHYEIEIIFHRLGKEKVLWENAKKPQSEIRTTKTTSYQSNTIA